MLPPILDALKTEVGWRWPMTSLLDVLKETDLRVGFTVAFKTLASREVVSRKLGTNAGLKRMAASNREVDYLNLRSYWAM